MRKSILRILAALVLCAGLSARVAQADTYDPIFSCSTPCGSLPTAPDVSFGGGSTVVNVSYYGYFFPIFLIGGGNPFDSYVWFGIDTTTLPTPFDHTLSFDISDTSTGVDQFLIVGVPDDFSVLNHRESGSLVFTPVPTPEPNPALLMLIGLFMFAFLSKRRSIHKVGSEL